MGYALSTDLRVRVSAAVDEGATPREAAARFDVSAASVSRWRTLAREQGHVGPRVLGGDRRSRRIEAQAALVLRLLDEMRDTTIEEPRQALGERGHRFGYGTLRRFFKRHRITRKRDRSCRRAGPSRRPDTPFGLVRRPASPRTFALGLE